MKTRLASIDIFRALTMLLMIFVNDLWTLQDIPRGLEHTRADEDGMGLADVVFPAFLFIVGLSIPFALKARINKGDTTTKVFIHILTRSLALIVMGFFMVNEDRLSGTNGFKIFWQISMLIAFILIWNDYVKKNKGSSSRSPQGPSGVFSATKTSRQSPEGPARVVFGIPAWVFQLTGIAILIILAAVYKSGTAPDIRWMRPGWWGILGLIGWAYLLCATLYLLAFKQQWLVPVFWFALCLINFLEFHKLGDFLPRRLLVVSASNHALVMSGVLGAQIFLWVREQKAKLLFPAVLLLPATILLIYGFAVRPLWGISKIMATPSWTSICAGISFLSFALVYIITDILGKTRWAGFLMPAGRSTLTCYLLPGLVYPFLWPLQQLLPDFWLTGAAGLIKSVLFGLLIVAMTGWLEKVNIRIRI